MTHMKFKPKSLMLLTSASATGIFINTHISELKSEYSETEGRSNQEIGTFFAPIFLREWLEYPFWTQSL